MGGLIGIATPEKNGLMDKNSFFRVNQIITSKGLIQVESWDGYSTLVYIRANGASGLYSIDGNWSSSARFTKLSGPLDATHFKAYRGQSGKIYVKIADPSETLTVMSVGANHSFKFIESNEDINSLIVLQ